MRFALIIVVILFLPILTFSQSSFTVSGTVSDESTGEAMIYASVYVPGTSIGATTNKYGHFSVAIPGDSATIVISYLGYQTKTIKVEKGNSSNLQLTISEDIEEMETVVIKRKKSQLEEIHNSTQMSTIKIPMKDIQNVPSIGGETDVIKVVQLLPGVQKGGEGQTGMFVRGGDIDQNLIILDEAVVYNISHLFGFFSVFNPDAIKDMTLIKGAFPAPYGGRLSSVLDIRMNEGNSNKFHARGGIGLLSSRLTLEGPIIKEKMSFMLSGRRSYIDRLFALTPNKLPYYFYDLNGKINYKISDKDRVYISSYFGNDILKVSEEEDDGQLLDFGFNLGNFTVTTRWNHIFNDKLFSNVSLIHTNFDYQIDGKFESNSVFISSQVDDIGVKGDFNYYTSEKVNYKFGAQVVNHNFRPNIVSTSGDITEFLKSQKPTPLNTLEYGLYGQHHINLYDKKWQITSGVRLTGAIVPDKIYAGFEPRIASKYSITKNDVVKASYSKMHQYMHLVSSSTVALPTDLWYPVTKNVKPQSSHQVAAGYSKMLKKLKTNLSVEGYYKWMNNLTEYKENANLVLNDDFESELLQGKGNSYGVEFLVKRDEGKLTGWIGYTLSWANRKFNGLNGDSIFPAKYDRRHNLNIVANYKITERWTVSAVWVYSSGSRFTPQVGAYVFPNAAMTGVDIIPVYTKRNAVSMSPTHRLDINFVRRSDPSKKFRGEWHFGAYNVYCSNTPYRINIRRKDGGNVYTQSALFGFIPSIAYNFDF